MMDRKVKKNYNLMIIAVIVLLANVLAKNDGLALLPPMGWNSWNFFGCSKVSPDKIKAVADVFTTTGMKDAGYLYIVVDDCWMSDKRDAKGNIQPNATFKDMKGLIDYVHSKGLKFGLYLDAGTGSCQWGRGGGVGCIQVNQNKQVISTHFRQDVKTLAEWGVDYIKMDWCHTDKNGNDCATTPETKYFTAQQAYDSLSKAVDEAGRPMVLSMCEWGKSKPWTWAKDVVHMWRTTFDMIATFNHSEPTWGCGMHGFDVIADMNADLADYAGPGHWNDPDMLQVGNNDPVEWAWGMPSFSLITDEQSRSHFSIWCVLAAPLMAGNNPVRMNNTIKSILTDPEALAVNQDRMGKQGKRIKDYGDLEVWCRYLYDSTRAIVFFNRSSKDADISIEMSAIGFDANTEYQVRDIWKKTTKVHKGEKYTYSSVLKNGGCGFIRIGKEVPIIKNRCDYDPTWPDCSSEAVKDNRGLFVRNVAVRIGSILIKTGVTIGSNEHLERIEILDMNGRTIRRIESKNILVQGPLLTIEGINIGSAALPSRTYLLKIGSGNKTTIMPFVH